MERSDKQSLQETLRKTIKKNESLLEKIRKLQSENKTLKSQNKTLENAWKKTEEYLQLINKNKNLEDVLHDIKTKTSLTKQDMNCPNPNCNNTNLHTRECDGYIIVICSKCGYQNRKRI